MLIPNSWMNAPLSCNLALQRNKKVSPKRQKRGKSFTNFPYNEISAGNKQSEAKKQMLSVITAEYPKILPCP